MAHFNDAEPTKPKRVQFPIFTDEAKWDEAVRHWINELKPEFQARLRVMQPFNYTSDSGAPFVLSLLHDLDIQDKHKDMLTVSADLNGLSLDGGVIEFEDDGAVVATLHTGATVREVGKVVLRPTIRVQLSHGPATYDAVWMLHRLREETGRYLAILLGGLARPDDDGTDHAEGGWLPIGVESSPAPGQADS